MTPGVQCVDPDERWSAAYPRGVSGYGPPRLQVPETKKAPRTRGLLCQWLLGHSKERWSRLGLLFGQNNGQEYTEQSVGNQPQTAENERNVEDADRGQGCSEQQMSGKA